MATGIIKKYNSSRGYGLLFSLGAPADAPLIFFHASQLKGCQSVPIGAEVRFQKVRSDSGVQAASVELLEYGGRRTLDEARRDERKIERRSKSNTSDPTLETAV